MSWPRFSHLFSPNLFLGRVTGRTLRRRQLDDSLIGRPSIGGRRRSRDWARCRARAGLGGPERRERSFPAAAAAAAAGLGHQSQPTRPPVGTVPPPAAQVTDDVTRLTSDVTDQTLGVSDLLAVVTDLASEVTDLSSDVTAPSSEVTSPSSEVTSPSSDVTGLPRDVTDLPPDVTDLSSDVNDLPSAAEVSTPVVNRRRAASEVTCGLQVAPRCALICRGGGRVSRGRDWNYESIQSTEVRGPI